MRKELTSEIIFSLYQDSMEHMNEDTSSYKNYAAKQEKLDSAINDAEQFLPQEYIQTLQHTTEDCTAFWGYLTFLEGMKAAIDLLKVFDPGTSDQLEF